jgi:hypothetical protein
MIGEQVGLSYGSTLIQLPEWFEEPHNSKRGPYEFKEEKRELALPNSLQFTRNGCVIEATVKSEKESLGLEDLEAIKSIFVADLASIDDLLPKIRKMVIRGRHQESIHYRRILEGNEILYFLFDGMESRVGRSPFKDACKLAMATPDLEDAAIVDMLDMRKSDLLLWMRHCVEFGLEYGYQVKGYTLRQTLERALILYRKQEELAEARDIAEKQREDMDRFRRLGREE